MNPVHQNYGPCPPGYLLKEVGGKWFCLKEGAEEIPLGEAPPKGNLAINPCPEGYELRNKGGTWMCVLGVEAITLGRHRSKQSLKIPGSGVSGTTSEPANTQGLG